MYMLTPSLQPRHIRRFDFASEGTHLRCPARDSLAPKNSTCVDCGASNPTFINNVLAVFVCVLCKKYHLQIFGASGLTYAPV